MDTYNLQQLKQALAPTGNPYFDSKDDTFDRLHDSYLNWLNTAGLTLEEKQAGAMLYAEAVTTINE